jgi:hypothetical protein
MRKNKLKSNGFVTFEHLSHAHMDTSDYKTYTQDMDKQMGNLKRSTSLHDKVNESEED